MLSGTASQGVFSKGTATVSAGKQQENEACPSQLPKADQALKFKNKGVLSMVPLINAAGSISATVTLCLWGE